MKITVLALLCLSLSAFAARINCRVADDGDDRYLCRKVIDLSKVITIDCIKGPKDSYEADLCENAIFTDSDNHTLNCQSPADGWEYFLCTRVPDTNKLVTINCLGDLKDDYQLKLCEKVDVDDQLAMRGRIPKKH
jgi:hypothetical protein